MALRARKVDGAQKSEDEWTLIEWKKSKKTLKRGRDAKAASWGRDVRRKHHENATLAPSLLLVAAVAIIICQSNGREVVMGANAYCHRKLKGGRPFWGIILSVPIPFFLGST